MRYVVAWIPANVDYQWMVWDNEQKKFISFHVNQKDADLVCKALNK